MLKSGEKFGAALKKARVAAGMTQRALANEVGSSDGSVSNWETGVTIPQDRTINKLNEALFGTAAPMPATTSATTVKKSGKSNSGNSLASFETEKLTAELKRRGFKITLTF